MSGELKPADVAALAALVVDVVQPVPPASAIRQRLMSRVSAWEAVRPIADVRTYDGEWSGGGAPGVEIRKLFRDEQSGRTTMLVRMQPGGRFPAHHHHDDEQCYVLQGDIRWGEIAYEQGDFVVMSRGTTHPEIYSVTGNVLLIVAGDTEFVHG